MSGNLCGRREKPFWQDGLGLGWGEWPGNIISLYFIALERLQYFDLFDILDALGHHPHAERMGHGDDGREEHVALFGFSQFRGKRPVDLQYVEVEPLQL